MDEPPAPEVGEIPPEVLEDLTLDHYARHYRSWLDESIPALDGRTPRQAATDPARCGAVEDLVRELEGMYQRALQTGQPAYDPTWPPRRYGLKPYRYYRQRRTTLMVKAPRSFMDQTLWPEYEELSRELQTYLSEVTDRVIREGIHGDDSDAEEVEEPKQLAGSRGDA